MDEIIHLGDFWNEAGIRVNREYIVRDNKEVGRQFARGYRYIKAAVSIYDDTRVINSWAINKAKVNEVAMELIEEIFNGIELSETEGKQRNLFASAITPDGLVNHLESILTPDKVYILKGQQGMDMDKVLEKVRDAAVERGMNVESFYCTMNPHKIEHLVIPDLDVSFTTENKYHCCNIEPYDVIDFNDFMDQSVLSLYSDVLKYNEAEFDMLLNKAIETIKQAKMLHDQMEKYYIPNMDFEAVQRCWECTLSRILEYAEE